MIIYRSSTELSLSTISSFYSSGFFYQLDDLRRVSNFFVIFVRDFSTNSNGGMLGKIKFMKKIKGYLRIEVICQFGSIKNPTSKEAI